MITLEDFRNPTMLHHAKRIIVVFAHDSEVIEAIADGVHGGFIIDPTLIGDANEIKQLCELSGIAGCGRIIQEMNPEAASDLAVAMIRRGEGDLLMKGLIDTKIILKSVVNSQNGIKAKPLLSHISALSFPALGRTLLMSDGAMNILPGVNEKIQILENALVVAKALGIEHPLIGLVGPVEKVNPKIQSTVDAEQIRAHFADAVGFTVDGPLAIDNLVSLEAAMHKGIQSNVAGKADILIFPNLDSGNVFYKSSVFLSNASAASIIVGATVPIVLTSRADNHETKFNSIVLGGLISDQLFDASHQPR